MSTTILGNYIQLASHFLVLFGFREVSKEEGDAIAIVIGLIGELVGFVTVHVGRMKHGDINILGVKKY